MKTLTMEKINKYIWIVTTIPLALFAITPFVQLIYNFAVSQTDFFHDFRLISFYQKQVSYVQIIGVFCFFILLFLFTRKNKIQPYKMTVLLKKSVPFLLFMGFLLGIVISTAVNGITEYVRLGDSIRSESFSTYFIYILVFFFCGMMVGEEKFRKIIFNAALTVSIPLGILSIIWKYVYKFPQYNDNGLAAVFFQLNHYGYYLNMMLILAGASFIFEKKKLFKYLYLFAFILNTVVLIINDTFGCQVAAICVITFQTIVLWRKKELRKNLLVIAGLYVLITLVVSIFIAHTFNNFLQFFFDIGSVARDEENAGSAGTGRWNYWVHTIGFIKERPLFGYGIEGIADQMFEVSGDFTNRPCEEYLTYAAFFGIPAALFYLSSVLYIVFDRIKNIGSTRGTAMAAFLTACTYLVSALFGNTMFYTTPFMFTMLGIAYSESFCKE